jgi:hypothetical protein
MPGQPVEAEQVLTTLPFAHGLRVLRAPDFPCAL